MSKTIEIKIFCTAQTRLNKSATREWLDHVGATEYPVPRINQECALHGEEYCECPDTIPPEVSDAGAVCGLSAKRCYASFEVGLNPNVTRVRKNWYDYLSNILASKHGSTIEHATWTFAIEGVSRVFTGELNRHRVGVAISEGSMRYIRFDDIGYWEPISLAKDNLMLMPTHRCKVCKGSGKLIKDKEGNITPLKATELPSGEAILTCSGCMGAGRLNSLTKEAFEEKKLMTRREFKNSFEEMEETYRQLCMIWGISEMKSFDTKKKLTSLFRRIIGMGVATGGTWTFNARALRHIIALRTSPHAEEEIAMVIGMIGKYIVDSEPALFGDFKRDSATGAWVPENVKI